MMLNKLIAPIRPNQISDLMFVELSLIIKVYPRLINAKYTTILSNVSFRDILYRFGLSYAKMKKFINL